MSSGWSRPVHSSDAAQRTTNPIRAIVDRIKVSDSGSEKSFISLALGKSIIPRSVKEI
jgi:hypothetical protein